MRYIFIGDVHGCKQELLDLAALLNLQSDDRLFFVGDLIEKGPDSEGVVQFVKSLSNAVCVQGNHESIALSLYKKGRNPENLSQDSVDYLSQLPFYRIDRFFGKNKFTVVHGGIYPAFYTNHSFLHQTQEGERTKRWKERVSRFRFCRFVDSRTGNPVSLGQENEHSEYWTSQYQGQDGLVIFGHQPFNRVHFSQWSIGLDTGCVYGNRLSALVVDESFQFSIVDVKARDRYAQPLVWDSYFQNNF